MDSTDYDIFDFIINDEDELMLLIYQQETEPNNPYIELDRESSSGVLHRNENDFIILNGLSNEVFDSIFEADNLLVCELSREEREEDTKIVYAYEAEVRY
ncbi:MAG: hypothetical protein LBR70_06370 [Lactobacillaceae bacterium]|jgi:hypothetical protein|nr:hypothetical protein [Lactobacillaceae bacterium]